MPDCSVRIVPFAQVERTAALLAGIDTVFFEASHTRRFADDAARAAFREQWLGRYLERDPAECFLALDGAAVAGYLAGSLIDPAAGPRFADIGYYAQLGHLTARLPAHLHINLAPAFRGRGIGARLIEAFARHAARASAPGMHVVTGRGLRNVGFYLRSGFSERAVVPWNGRDLVLLGRPLP